MIPIMIVLTYIGNDRIFTTLSMAIAKITLEIASSSGVTIKCYVLQMV
jgi:hypothetical protein